MTTARRKSVMTIKKFHFSDLSLAFQVRERVVELLIKFDKDENLEFDEGEIANALLEILHEDETEVSYVTRNVFRYDLNNDGKVTYEEFIDFIMEQHLGQLAIQRLHKQSSYKYGSKRQMTEQQFLKTINYAFKFLNIQNNDALRIIFSEIDLDKDGLLSYQHYFSFLREYFGSSSQAAIVIKTDKGSLKKKKTMMIEEGMIDADQNSIRQQKEREKKKLLLHIGKLINSQTRLMTLKFDSSKNLEMSENEITTLCRNGVKLSQVQTNQFLDFIRSHRKALNYTETVNLLLTFIFIQRHKRDHNLNQKADEPSFIRTVHENLGFLLVKPSVHILSDLYTLYDDKATYSDIYHMLKQMATTS